MPDQLDQQIEAMVVELLEASPPPPPASQVLEGEPLRPSPSSLSAGLLRLVATAAAVLAFGAIAFLVGRYTAPFPLPGMTVPAATQGTPSPEPSLVTEPPVSRGTLPPEPRFATEDLGEEVRLLPPSGEVGPDVGPDLVGPVVGGRIEGTDLEVFSWRTEDSLEGSCLQVVGFRARHSICGGGVGPEPDIRTPFAFPRLEEATGGVLDVVVVWRTPEGTSVVSLQSGDTRLWQRPVEGIAAFVVDETSGSLITLSAWDPEGASLGGTGISMREAIGDPAPVGIEAIQIDGVWVFQHDPDSFGAALHSGTPEIVDGCLYIDQTVVVWQVDRIQEAAEAIAAVRAGESPQLLIGGGGISLEEGTEPDEIPTVITDLCPASAVWFGAP